MIMARKRFSAEDIVEKLRRVDGITSLGLSIGEALRAIDVSPSSYYRWRSEYGGLTRTLHLLDEPSRAKCKIQA
jgi:putative transposase